MSLDAIVRNGAGRFLDLVLRALVVAAVALALVGCGGSDAEEAGREGTAPAAGDPSQDKLAQIVARGTLIEYFEPDYAPQSMNVVGAQRPADTKCAANQLTAAEVTGYDNEITKRLAKKLGVEACFVSPQWTEVTAGNWGDRWDIAYGSGSINADRMERLYMTQPYYAVPNRYFVAADSPFQTPSDLNGKRIGSCADCSHELYLKGELEIPTVDIELNVENPQIVTFEDEGPGLAAVAKGKIDAFLAADPVGRANIKNGAKLRPLDEIAFTYYPSGFVDKSSGLSARAFVARVNELVRGFQSDGTLKRMSVRWFGQDYASAAAEFDVEALGQVVK